MTYTYYEAMPQHRFISDHSVRIEETMQRVFLY